MKKILALLLALLLLPACQGSRRVAGSCTLSISCQNILDNQDRLAENKRGLLPEDGWLLAPTQVAFYRGETVFDLLQRVTRENHIHLEFSKSPLYNSAYVEGIGNLYELDCGAASGWMFQVNGAFPNMGASAVELQDGDQVQWSYTLNLGGDLGQGVEEQP